MTEEVQSTIIEETVLQEQPAVTSATTTYSVFVPDFTIPTGTIISSTFDRYNESIRSSLEKDIDIIQQKVDLSLQTESNDFFRNVKW